MLVIEFCGKRVKINMKLKTEYKCVCGFEEFHTKQDTKLNNGIQTGLYCSGCGRWIKWLGKEEVKLFEKYLEFMKTEKIEEDIEEDEFENQFDISQVSNEDLLEELAKRIRKGKIK